MSPNFYPDNPKAKIILMPWGRQIARAIIGDYRQWTPRNELEAKYWAHKQRIEALFAMLGLVDLVDHMDLSSLELPVLVLHSDKDTVISLDKLKKRFDEIGSKSKKQVTVNETEDYNGHVLAGDILSPKSTDIVKRHIIDFLKSLGIAS